jgi:HSP20 family protein
MSIIKWSNNSLFPALDNVWDDFFKNDFISRGLDLGTSIPAVNLTEDEKNYLIDMAVPGFDKKDLKINLDGDFLTISSEKKEEKEEKNGKKVTKKEFGYSYFSRGFRLPDNVKKEKLDAEYKDGILKISLPKAEPSSPNKEIKQIAIK